MSSSSDSVSYIGVTRFSLFIPESGSWRLSSTKTSEEAYRRALFDEERLRSRFDIFSTISVPQLEAASKSFNVRHYIQYSSLLPQKFQDLLAELAERYSFLRLFKNDSTEQHAGLIESAARELTPATGVEDKLFVWYRLDDDDILSTNYFARLARYARQDNVGNVVSFGLGYAAAYHAQTLWNIRTDYRPKNSIGQAYISSIDSSGRVISPPPQNHALIDRWAPTILDSREPMFITVLHPTQDGHDRSRVTDLYAKITEELSARPYAEPDSPRLNGFAAVPHSRFGKTAILHESRRNSRVFPVALSNSPHPFPVSSAGSLCIDFQVDSQGFGTSSRLLIALRFHDGERPEPSGKWVELDRRALVTGVPITANVLQSRVVMLRDDFASTVQEVNIWVSRDSSPDTALQYLSVTSSEVRD